MPLRQTFFFVFDSCLMSGWGNTVLVGGKAGGKERKEGGF